MFTSQAHNQKMMDDLIDQEETIRVCHYCHTKVFMNDAANDGQSQLIADKQEIQNNNPGDVVGQELEDNGAQEMAMWLGAGNSKELKKLK